MSNYSMDEDEFLDAFNAMQKERGVHIRPIYNRLWEKVEYQPIETQRELMKETFDDYEMKYEKDGFVYTEAYKESAELRDEIQDKIQEYNQNIIDQINTQLELAKEDDVELGADMPPVEFAKEEDLNNPELLENFAINVLGENYGRAEEQELEDTSKEEVVVPDEIEDEDLRQKVRAEANELFSAYVAYVKEPNEKKLRQLNTKIKEYNKDAQTLKDRKPIPEYIGEIHKKELAGKIDRSFLTHAIQDMKADQKAVIHMYLINKNIYAEDVARVIQKAHTEKLDATDMFKEFSKIANENKRTNVKELKGNGQSMGI